MAEHSAKRCGREWEEALRLLREYAQTEPAGLLCLHDWVPELALGHEPDGEICEAHLIIPDRGLIFLGTVATAQRSERLWRKALNDVEEREDWDAITRLTTDGWEGVLPDWIPIPEEQLSLVAIAGGVARWMDTFCPALAPVPVVWVPESLRVDIRAALWRRPPEDSPAYQPWRQTWRQLLRQAALFLPRIELEPD